MITIIIPVFNKLELTQECIDSIYKHTEYNSFKILIVDNASSDGTHEYLKAKKKEYSNFNFIRNEENVGFGRANNQAVKEADTEKVLLLNNDMYVTENWLVNLNSELETNQDIKVVGCKLLYPEGDIQQVFTAFSKENTNLGQNISYNIYRNFPSEHPAINKNRFVQALAGACMLTYKDFFLEMGSFDEEYINGFEDTDFCLRVIEKGSKILYSPKTTIYHYESRTAGRFDNALKNIEIFNRKWKNKIKPDDYIFYKEDGFNLNHTIYKWETFKTIQIDNGNNIELKKEIIEIIIEKKFENPELLIFFKSESEEKNKAFLKKIQITTSKEFELIIANSDNYKIYENYHNLSLLKLTSIEELKNILLETKLENIIFLQEEKEISNYDWNSSINNYKTKEIIQKIDYLLLNNNINEKDIELFELLVLFTKDTKTILALAKILEKNNLDRKVVELLNKYITLFKDKKLVFELLLISLKKLGDNDTYNKLNDFYKKLT